MVGVQPTMTETLESHLRSMMGQVEGLRAIVITDRWVINLMVALLRVSECANYDSFTLLNHSPILGRLEFQY